MLLSTGCATPYAYQFHLDNPVAREDADVRVELVVDPTGTQSILVDVTNKTDQILQVQWDQLSLRHPDGSTTSPRPDADLGWILPQKTQAARLIPFGLPGSGHEAELYDGQRFQLEIPMLVRREPRVYRYALSAHVERL